MSDITGQAQQRQPDLNNSERPQRTPTELWIAGIAALVLAVLCIIVLQPFISAAAWSAMLCFTTWPLFLRLVDAVGGRRGLAALIATILLAAIILVPVAILGATLAENVSSLVKASQKLIEEGPPTAPDWVASVPLVGGRMADYWNYLNQGTSVRLEELSRLLPAAKIVVVWGGKALADGLLEIVLSLLIAFFFYRDGHAVSIQLESAMRRIGGERAERLLDLAGETIRAVVYGVLGTSLLQGVAAAIGFLIAGVPGAATLGFVTFLLSLLPGGPALVAAPAAFWLYRQRSLAWAIFMMVWAVIVGTLDSVIRPLLISSGGGKTPLILVMLGVFGGAAAFGLIGLFLGPTIVALGYSLLTQWSEPDAAPSA